MNTSAFRIEVEGHLAHLRFTRPKSANALGVEFWREFGPAVRELDRNGTVRALILSGEGKHFCSGMDVSAFSPELAGTDTPRARDAFSSLVRELQHTVNALEEARFPVIAAVHGACVGGGLDLVACCDLRVAAEDARFRVEEINLAMMADLGSLQRLPKLMPEGVVKELAYLGRTLSAKRARALGFVAEVHPTAESALEAARELARAIASKSPLAVSGTKAAIGYARDHSVSDGLAWAAERQAAIWSLPEVMEAVRARMSQESPSYSDLNPLSSLR